MKISPIWSNVKLSFLLLNAIKANTELTILLFIFTRKYLKSRELQFCKVYKKKQKSKWDMLSGFAQ